MEHVILLGKPCSGKGTLAKEYKNKGYYHLSGSDMLRNHLADPDAKYYNEAHFALTNGVMIKDEIINGIFEEEFKKIGKFQNIVFDGYPRSISQAQAILNLVGGTDNSDIKVIVLDVSDESCISRLKERLTCPKCSASFSKTGKHAPKKLNTCDYCSENLYIRPDDSLDKFLPKIKEYDEKTKPIIAFLLSEKIKIEIV